MPKGYQDRRPDNTAIEAHYSKYPTDNVGVLTTGLIGIDLDLPNANHDWRSGEKEWEELQEKYGRAPNTLTAITGSGGKHLLFRRPEHLQSINKLPMLPQSQYKGVIDVKANGGLIVVEPSLHISGNRYRWVDRDAEIAVLPEWLYSYPEEEPGETNAGVPSRKSNTVTKQRPRKQKTPEEGDLLDIKAEKMRSERTNPRAVLANPTRSLLQEGRPGPQQSRVVMSICKGAASVGYDAETLYDELLDRTNRGGLGILEARTEGGPAAGRERFDRAMHQAYRWLAEEVGAIEQLRVEAESYPWPPMVRFRGRNGKRQAVKGPNCRSVLMAGLAVAEKTLTTSPMLGCDDLEKKTGLHRDTCRKALQALEGLGWWTAENPTIAGVQNAYLYHFALDPGARLKPSMMARAIVPKKVKINPDEWLAEFLSLRNGSALSSEVKWCAKASGIPERTIKRSAGRLHIASTRLPQEHAPTLWSLPNDMVRIGA